jgi:hypothetical protein
MRPRASAVFDPTTAVTAPPARIPWLKSATEMVSITMLAKQEFVVRVRHVIVVWEVGGAESGR